jgi:ATP-binding cassette, subfamily A (ABC1), member 3
MIKGISVLDHPRAARVSLGVCPQFTAIDSQLTVRQHLFIYGRLKGLHRGPELDDNIQMLMRATGLDVFADRLASKLSGGNRRKLALTIALIGELVLCHGGGLGFFFLIFGPPLRRQPGRGSRR